MWVDGVLRTNNNTSWKPVEVQLFAQSAQKFGGAVQTDRRLEVGCFQCLAELAAILAVQTDIRVGIGEGYHVVQRAAQRENQVDLCANTLNQPLNLGQVGGRVEVAIGRTNDVDLDNDNQKH